MRNKLFILKKFLSKSGLNKEAQETQRLTLEAPDTLRPPTEEAFQLRLEDPFNIVTPEGELTAPTSELLSAAPEAEGGLGSKLDKVRAGTEEIKKGDRDSDSDSFVTEAQKLLEEHRYTLDRFGADGKFGSETESRVLEFQKNNKLEATGVINSRVLILLESPIAVPVSPVAAAVPASASTSEEFDPGSEGLSA